MELMYDIFPIIIFVLSIILLVVLIILAIRMINMLKKVDHIVTDVTNKVSKLDRAFSVIDGITDSLSGLNDKIVSVISTGIKKFFTRKKSKGEETDEE